MFCLFSQAPAAQSFFVNRRWLGGAAGGVGRFSRELRQAGGGEGRTGRRSSSQGEAPIPSISRELLQLNPFPLLTNSISMVQRAVFVTCQPCNRLAWLSHSPSYSFVSVFAGLLFVSAQSRPSNTTHPSIVPECRIADDRLQPVHFLLLISSPTHLGLINWTTIDKHSHPSFLILDLATRLPRIST